MINCVGYWKDQTRSYTDKNLQVVIDVFPLDGADPKTFFTGLKDELCRKLDQQKIYVLLLGQKEELISFKEFFLELGIQRDSGEMEGDFLLASQLLASHTFVWSRLAYETTVLQRDFLNKKIIWERKICGILLRSEFEDNLPEDILLCGADQLDKLGEAIFSVKNFAIIGEYEFQRYILAITPYRSLLDVNLGEIEDENIFVDQQGKVISTKRFVELFSMSVFSHYMVLRDENFQPNQIKINVGSDGSLQQGTSLDRGNYVLHCPATIMDRDVQIKVIETVEKMIELYEQNRLDAIALLQTKARTNYIKNRAILRKVIRSKANL